MRRSLQHVAKPDIGLSGPAGAGYPAAPRRSLLGARDRLSASTPSPQRPLPPMGWATRRVPRGPAQPPEPKADPWPELVAGGIPCPPNASSAHLATSSAFMASGDDVAAMPADGGGGARVVPPDLGAGDACRPRLAGRRDGPAPRGAAEPPGMPGGL